MSAEEFINAAKERLGELLEPINGGMGEDISYDEQFDEIKAETEKIQSLEGDTCDWSTIEITSGELVTAKSKDDRIACYYAACEIREATL